MNLRSWLQNNRIASVGIAALVLAVSVILILSRPSTSRFSPAQWWYDLNTEELFTRSSEEPGPVTAPSGGMGVRAHVFSCGDCGDGESLILGFLAKPAPSTLSADDAGADQPPQQLVSLPMQPPEWHSTESSQGRQIAAVRQRLGENCQGEIKRCLP